jgi:hypothetical protein
MTYAIMRSEAITQEFRDERAWELTVLGFDVDAKHEGQSGLLLGCSGYLQLRIRLHEYHRLRAANRYTD